MAVFYSYQKTLDEEKMEFLQCLYHDKRNGQAIRLRKQENKVSQYSTFDLKELAATGTDMSNIYTSVNCFRGNKRTADSLFNYCSIFIDIDCHFEDPDQINEAKMRTVEILEAAYASGKLMEPTMITDTGRGYGLQYVLRRSIAKTDRTLRQRTFFKTVRKNLFERYRNILAIDSMAGKVDASVLDDARVCRLPGTFNQSAGVYCRLIGMSQKYYELSELVKGCQLWTWIDDDEYRERREEKEKKRKERMASGKIIPFGEIRYPFLHARIDQLMKLQDIRGSKCTDDCREQLLFIAYSALVQLDRETAVVQLQQINERFTDPLGQSEIDHIVKETDGSNGVDHHGFYKLKNEYLIERLNLNAEEIKILGLDMGWHRTAVRQSARQEKKETRKRIIELLKKGVTYNQIAETANVSRRKVCMVAKEEGLTRYRKSKCQKVCVELVESANSADKSVCVESLVSAGTLLSTPVGVVSGAGELDWYSWLAVCAQTSSEAKELLALFNWSSAFSNGGAAMEDFFDREMPLILGHIELVPQMLQKVALRYIAEQGIQECLIVFQENIADFPSILALCNKKKEVHKSKKTDVATETAEQRKARIDRHLKHYRDERFDIIKGTEEYERRLDPDVLRIFEITCMQVQRLKRDFLYVEGKKILTAEIKECFSALTYKDIVIICERIGHQGTILNVEKPFFYIVQAVYKYHHPEAAAQQAGRIADEKAANAKKNKFCNFEQRDIDFAWIEANAMRELLGEARLTEQEYQKALEKNA